MSKIFFRRHLPHLHFDEGSYFITARLYDPDRFQSADSNDRILKAGISLTEDFKRDFITYDDALHNRQTNIDYLKYQDVAEILASEFHRLDNKEYTLIAFTILSNHFHLLFNLLKGNSGISKIMKNIKGRSSLFINRKLNRTGKLWQDESYDRWIRNDIELYFTIKYILENPVKAGLVNNWSEWKYTYCKPEYIIL